MVKDIFLWLNSTGMRIGDVKTIRINNMNFDRKTQLISWTQTKTSKMVSVPLNDISGYIFTKYSRGKSLEQFLFPKVSQQKFNKQLKNLLKDLRFNRMVSKPMRVGSKVVNSEPKPLWELISSHSGRRGCIKNSIDLGRMWSNNLKQKNKKLKVIRNSLMFSNNAPRNITKTTQNVQPIKSQNVRPDSRAYWGTPTWYLFHTIAEKIDKPFWELVPVIENLLDFKLVSECDRITKK